MRVQIVVCLVVVCFGLFSFSDFDFKKEQLRYSRVREAYAEKETFVLNLLDSANIDVHQMEIYLRAFKLEKKIELWAKNKSDSSFQKMMEYEICASSGHLGPKRQEGDFQVPEGFYYIKYFNPASSFYLSLGLNYPNVSDRILGNKEKLGSNIYIHGNCVTIGCMPITDDKIKELYVFCVEARNNGQIKIPVTSFPFKFNRQNTEKYFKQFSNNNDAVALWRELKIGFDYFNLNKKLPSIQFLKNGRHAIN